jgi:hypothetical protein
MLLVSGGIFGFTTLFGGISVFLAAKHPWLERRAFPFAKLVHFLSAFLTAFSAVLLPLTETDYTAGRERGGGLFMCLSLTAMLV